MAEVPPHLLERAAARRAALSGGGAETPAPEPAAAALTGASGSTSSSTAVSVAVAIPEAAAPPARLAKGSAAPVTVRAPGPPKGTTFAKMASVFLLASVPLWGIFMFDAWATPRAVADTPAALGQSLFNANCTACHGADGSGSDGGKAGRPLYNGEVEKTFPDPVQQATFVKHGSCAVGRPYGNPAREGGQHVAKGGMPAFSTLTDSQLIYLINYERHRLKKTPDEFPVNVLAKVSEDAKVLPKTDPFNPLTFKLDVALACK